MPVNNYTFDGLYRRHHPLDHRCDDDHRHVDNERSMDDRGGGDHTSRFEGERDGNIAQEEDPSRPDGPCRSSPTAADRLSSYAKRVECIMKEEYGTFFDGMTQSARELYQVRCAATREPNRGLLVIYSKKLPRIAQRTLLNPAPLLAPPVPQKNEGSRGKGA